MAEMIETRLRELIIILSQFLELPQQQPYQQEQHHCVPLLPIPTDKNRGEFISGYIERIDQIMTETKQPLRSALKKQGSKQNKKKVCVNLQDDDLDKLNNVIGEKKEVQQDRGVKWRASVREQRISKLRASIIDDLFYTDDEIADFRYSKFMEECGLDPEDFD